MSPAAVDFVSASSAPGPLEPPPLVGGGELEPAAGVVELPVLLLGEPLELPQAAASMTAVATADIVRMREMFMAAWSPAGSDDRLNAGESGAPPLCGDGRLLAPPAGRAGGRDR